MDYEYAVRVARAAEVIGRSARVNARVAAMMAANQERLSIGAAPTYAEAAFLAVIDDESCGVNDVTIYLWHD